MAVRLARRKTTCDTMLTRCGRSTNIWHWGESCPLKKESCRGITGYSMARIRRGKAIPVNTASDRGSIERLRALISPALLLSSLVGFLAFTVWLNAHERAEQHFVFLARSFLHGDLAFREMPGPTFADTSLFNGQYYWPLGPFPAVLLMPFEFVAGAFGAFFYQGYVQPLLVLTVLLIVYHVAQVTGYGAEDAAYLAFGFTFSTAFLGVAVCPWSWYFSQVITCLLVFAAIAEMITKQRPWVLGVLFALVLATRVTAALGVLWCVGEILIAHYPWRKKAASLIAIALPIFFVAALLMVYNYLRFGDPFDPGYAKQLIGQNMAESRALGIFSIRHLPGNLYALLLAAPISVARRQFSPALTFPYVAANPWGMSIWVTSPCFLYLLGLRHRDGTSRLLLLTSLVIAIPLLLYYGVGYRQFGYRYSLDFLPFLYYLLLRNYRQQRGDLSAFFKSVLLGSAVWNLYLFTEHFIRRVER